jgi:hypothetical protein
MPHFYFRQYFIANRRGEQFAYAVGRQCSKMLVTFCPTTNKYDCTSDHISLYWFHLQIDKDVEGTIRQYAKVRGDENLVG